MNLYPTETAGGGAAAVAAAEETQARPAFRLNRILVPSDFSGCSKKALAYAIPFARQFNAELDLLHIVPNNPPVPEMGPVDVESIEDAEREMKELEQGVRGKVRCRTVIRHGEPAIEIVEAAREFGSDLIVLSTHGRTGLARMLMGSTAERVVRHAGCPVLVVREHEHDFVPSGE